jgi:hypothetical protein
MPDHPYYRAARAADSTVTEFGGLEGWAEHYEVDLGALLHLCEQRAIRAILTQFMGVNPDSLDRPLGSPDVAVDIPKHLKPLISVLAASYLDGWAGHMHIQPETGV